MTTTSADPRDLASERTFVFYGASILTGVVRITFGNFSRQFPPKTDAPKLSLIILVDVT